MLVVDVNGDHENELIVGNAPGYDRRWAEWHLDSGGMRKWIYHPIDPENAQYGTGRLDVVAPGKEGLFVYYNEGS